MFSFISDPEVKSEFFIDSLGSYEISENYGVDVFLAENGKINIK